MASSTLLSNSHIPRTALTLIAVSIAAWASAAVYTVYLNPEVRLYRHASDLKESWSKAIADRHEPKFVFCGGSSCATSIMGQRFLLEHNLSVVNLGLNAGMGARLLAGYAYKNTDAGDTLVVALEPVLLKDSDRIPTLGQQFAVATSNFDLLECHSPSDYVSAFLALRPGGSHFFTLLGKLFGRQPLYRYAPQDFDNSGYQRVTIHRDFGALPEKAPSLSPSARRLLSTLRSKCETRGIRLVYSLPWFYTPRALANEVRSANVDFLIQIGDFMAVLADEHLGVNSDRAQYADTPLHLTPDGAAMRTDILARELKEWSLWSPGDLRRMRDLKADGSPR